MAGGSVTFTVGVTYTQPLQPLEEFSSSSGRSERSPLRAAADRRGGEARGFEATKRLALAAYVQLVRAETGTVTDRSGGCDPDRALARALASETMLVTEPGNSRLRHCSVTG